MLFLGKYLVSAYLYQQLALPLFWQSLADGPVLYLLQKRLEVLFKLLSLLHSSIFENAFHCHLVRLTQYLASKICLCLFYLFMSIFSKDFRQTEFLKLENVFGKIDV